MNKIIIIGAFHEVIELAMDCGFDIIGIIDNNRKEEFGNLKYLGSDLDAQEIYRIYPKVPLVISPDIPQKRKELFIFYSNIGFQFQNLISPKATISKSVKFGKGILVQQGVTISSNVDIKNGVRINVNACIMHDSIIKDFVTIAPCAVILGRANIGEEAYIGANATILPSISIGERVTVGAGSVVTKGIEPNIIVVGVPAKQIKSGQIK